MAVPCPDRCVAHKHVPQRIRRGEKPFDLPLCGTPYSITSSAATCSVSKTVRPSALAVFRLSTVSRLIGRPHFRNGHWQRYPHGNSRHARAPAACRPSELVMVPPATSVGCVTGRKARKGSLLLGTISRDEGVPPNPLSNLSVTRGEEVLRVIGPIGPIVVLTFKKFSY